MQEAPQSPGLGTSPPLVLPAMGQGEPGEQPPWTARRERPSLLRTGIQPQRRPHSRGPCTAWAGVLRGGLACAGGTLQHHLPSSRPHVVTVRVDSPQMSPGPPASTVFNKTQGGVE